MPTRPVYPVLRQRSHPLAAQISSLLELWRARNSRSSSVGFSVFLQWAHRRRIRRPSQHGVECSAHEERLEANVDEAGDRTGGVVGMERGEHKVARQRGLDGDDGGLKVADFAQHDDVRVLAEKAPQGRGEVHADLFVHLRLRDAIEGGIRRGPRRCRRSSSSCRAGGGRHRGSWSYPSLWGP